VATPTAANQGSGNSVAKAKAADVVAGVFNSVAENGRSNGYSTEAKAAPANRRRTTGHPGVCV
jgi:hypothetical protein